MKHSENTSVYVYIKEAYHQSKKPILTFIGGLAAIWGYFNFFFDKRIGWYVLSVMAIVSILFAIWKFFYWFSQIKRGRMTVELFNRKEVILIRDGFDTNMEKLLSELPSEELQNFVFVMGIDRTGNLSISTKQGVVSAVLNHLDKFYRIGEKLPSAVAQQQLDNYLQRNPHADEINKLKYGTCVDIHLQISPIHDSSAQSIPCNLLFVANSRQEDPNDKEKGENITGDGEANIIVPKVFEHLRTTTKYKGAMIGVMGTNGMRQPYQVMFSQTINQYALICIKDKQNPLVRLFISIREADYMAWNMSLSQLGEYVRFCVKYYKKEDNNQ